MNEKGPIRSYKDLITYQKAYELSLEVYGLTKGFPKEELYGLVSQMRRCAISIPSNIAEGYRRGKKEYVHFLKVADGSCAELETQMSLAGDLKYISKEDISKALEKVETVGRLLNKLISSLEK